MQSWPGLRTGDLPGSRPLDSRFDAANIFWHIRVHSIRRGRERQRDASGRNVTVGCSAKAVANYFLSKYGKHGITPLKMQKLVYVAHGWHLAFHDEPLVDDEYAEAWEYGPVFSSLYHEFKHRGRLPIVEPATDLDSDLNEMAPKIPKSDKQTRRLLDKVWDVYGERSGLELSRMTHRRDSPWATTRERSGGRKNANIRDEDIMAYYKTLREQNQRNGNND